MKDASAIGIVSYGGYLPRLRLSRRVVVDANAWGNAALKSHAKGERTMCNWDEDVVTMAAEAARACFGPRPPSGLTALVLGPGGGIARLVGTSSRAVDFVDHYRAAGREFDYQWEERWIRDEGYLKIVPPVITAVLEETRIPAAKVTHFCMPCTLPRVAQL